MPAYLALREITGKASGERLEIESFEADIQHLIDTYIKTSEPRKISPFDNIGLMDLIVKSGIAEEDGLHEQWDLLLRMSYTTSWDRIELTAFKYNQAFST